MASTSEEIAESSNNSCRTIYRNLTLLIDMYEKHPEKLDKLVDSMVKS